MRGRDFAKKVNEFMKVGSNDSFMDYLGTNFGIKKIDGRVWECTFEEIERLINTISHL